MTTKKETDAFVIKDAFPYDGTYEIDLSSLNGYDLRLIKQVARVRAHELDEALEGGDYDVHIACAVIAMKRAGKFGDEQVQDAIDVLMRQPLGAVYWRPGSMNGKDADASDPPPETPLA